MQDSKVAKIQDVTLCEGIRNININNELGE